MGNEQSKKRKPERTYPDSPVESYLGISRASETGLERVKSLFLFKRNCHVPEEFNDLSMVVTVSTVGGVFFGGLIGSRQMADKFIMLNQHSKFSSVMQAQRELHSASFMGFARQGIRWGCRLGAFSGIFSLTAIFLATYRDKDDAWNYVASGSLLGGLYRANWGFMPFLGGSTLGLLVSLPLGLLMIVVEKMLVANEEKVRAREKLFVTRCERLNYWKLKEQDAAALIDGIGVRPDGMNELYEKVPKKEHGKLVKWIQKFFDKFRNN